MIRTLPPSTPWTGAMCACVLLAGLGRPLAGQSGRQCRNLVASQTITVGSVCVAVTAEQVRIEISTSSDARMTETRAAVATDLAGFPLSESGVPRLGQFPYTTVHRPPTGDATYEVPRTDLDPAAAEILVAVHASVVDELQVEHGAWVEGRRFQSQGMPATYFAVPMPDGPTP